METTAISTRCVVCYNKTHTKAMSKDFVVMFKGDETKGIVVVKDLNRQNHEVGEWTRKKSSLIRKDRFLYTFKAFTPMSAKRRGKYDGMEKPLFQVVNEILRNFVDVTYDKAWNACDWIFDKNGIIRVI